MSVHELVTTIHYARLTNDTGNVLDGLPILGGQLGNAGGATGPLGEATGSLGGVAGNLEGVTGLLGGLKGRWQS